MSITFSIQGIHEEDGDELPCAQCGLSFRDNRSGKHSPMECLCMGYGGAEELPQPQFSMNVANGNGYAILDALNLPVECYGEADPRDILARLDAAQIPTIEPSVEQHPVVSYEGVRDGVRIFNGGRSTEQVARYRDQLRKIASKAAKYDRKVIWG